MRTAFLIAPLIVGVLYLSPATARTEILPTGEVGVNSAPSKSISVMSMGQIEAIDFELKRVRINGVSYGFDSATRFFDRLGHKTQSTQLKTGDWINFWIKSGSTQTTPALEQVALLGKV